MSKSFVFSRLFSLFACCDRLLHDDPFFLLFTPKKISDYVLIFSFNRNKVCKALIYNTIVYGGDFFMHCWKTINLERQFGFYRVFLLSSIIMMMVFSLIYVPMNLVYSSSFYDNHLLAFVLGLVSIYPLHKLIHLLPILPYVNKMRWKWDRKLIILPIVSLRVNRPISKHLYMLALIAPFLFINSILLAGCIQFPHHSHYFAILLAFHSGICAIDFIYAKQLMYSPRKALIEENEDGYEILIYQ
jgi:hypothetical protein